MIDRLNDLRARLKESAPLIPKDQEQSGLTKVVSLTNLRFDEIRRGNTSVRNLIGEFETSVRAEREKEIKDSVRRVMDRNNILLNEVKAIIETLTKQSELDGDEAVDQRMKETIQATIVKQFQTILADTEKVQSDFSEAVKRKIVQQVRIIDADASEEVIQRCIEDPQGAQMLAQQKLIGASGEIIGMVKNIEDKYRDIKLLEQNVNLMHRMFLDLAALIHEQGELLNSVEQHVDKAAIYIEKSVKELDKAEKYQKSARYKKCCLLVILLIIVIVIVAPTVSVLGA
jgi:t-SNARE complex subunit (syntaxin)